MKKSLIEILTPRASKKTLLIVAGFVWAGASFLLLARGTFFILLDLSYLYLKILLWAILFFLFYRMLVIKVSVRYLNRIISLKKKRPCVFSFFSIRGYILMTIMMTMGIGLRNLKYLPHSWLSCLYFGVGIPLLISSFRFFSAGFNYKKEPSKREKQGDFSSY